MSAEVLYTQWPVMQEVGGGYGYHPTTNSHQNPFNPLEKGSTRTMHTKPISNLPGSCEGQPPEPRESYRLNILVSNTFCPIQSEQIYFIPDLRETYADIIFDGTEEFILWPNVLNFTVKLNC
eukprot:4130814-Amphidinium_carterae.1